ncbi:putative hemin import ATP-binding protein [Brochothrix campestris FSL F6-1037]|uniref:Putative hemin import ATP-binding protein n=1 Tax=Brochothrix campestris FSL F6-1037 TaxID=1265861 RepID=W7D142_9LIST|nr:putative hemin import ATP-binding protein [Brochothrix campestris FSL F6-1037]
MSNLFLKNITKEFVDDNGEKIIALNKVSLTVNSGELIAIVGPSGSGKSTFLSIAGALLQPTTGQIKINETDISRFNEQELSRLRLQEIGFILQSSNLVPYLNVLEQLLLVKQLQGKVTAADKQQAQELLTELGLADKLKNFPSDLSGGQKQRVAIGRALMNDPSVILADEPTASLDTKKAHEVVQLLVNETKKTSKGRDYGHS